MGFFEEVRMQQIAKIFNHKVRMCIVLEALCGQSMDAKGLTEQKRIVSKCIEHGKMQPFDTLWAFDGYVHRNRDALKTFPMVLKAIYDEEWVSEEKILEYYNNEAGSGETGFEEAKRSAAPFLKWLATVESDD